MLNRLRNFLHVKTGDSVMVIAGGCRGKTGNIIAVDTKRNMVKISGLNLKTHYIKKDKENNGSIEKKEGWLHASNVRRLNSEN